MFQEFGQSASSSWRACRAAPRRTAGTPRSGGIGPLRYQPFVELASGRPLGAEAVTRRSERNGARRSRATASAALRQACVDAAGWGFGILAFDVPATLLHGGDLLEQVGGALDASGLSPGRLTLEFGETLLTEIDVDLLLTLAVIRDLGVGVVLDDFGTGLASLRMLKRLPLTGLKLDVSLVREVPENHEDAAIARAVIATAHALGLEVSAAGIDRESQREALANFGCESGQGPLFEAAALAGIFRQRT